MNNEKNIQHIPIANLGIQIAYRDYSYDMFEPLSGGIRGIQQVVQLVKEVFALCSATVFINKNTEGTRESHNKEQSGSQKASRVGTNNQNFFKLWNFLFNFFLSAS